jgi:hypothetical protein
MKRLILIASVLMASPSFAQQQPPLDSAILQRVLDMTKVQRNQLLDALNEVDARRAMMGDDLARAQARIKELEKPAADPKN